MATADAPARVNTRLDTQAVTDVGFVQSANRRRGTHHAAPERPIVGTRGTVKPRVETPSEVMPLRSIAGPTLFTAIALATLLMFPAFIGQAQAFGLTITKCPCNFLPALLFATKEVAKFGFGLAIQECTKSAEGIRATGANAFLQRD